MTATAISRSKSAAGTEISYPMNARILAATISKAQAGRLIQVLAQAGTLLTLNSEAFIKHDQPISSSKAVESIRLNSTQMVLVNKRALDAAKNRDLFMVPFATKNFTLYPLLELSDFAFGELSSFVKGYLRARMHPPS